MSKLYMRHYQSDDTDAFIEAFSNGAKKVERVLRNKSCEFVPVMVPEALSVNETKRFLSVLRGHKIPVKDIIVKIASTLLAIVPIVMDNICYKRNILMI